MDVSCWLNPSRMINGLSDNPYARCACVWGVCVALELLDAHLGNGTGHRTASLMEPLLLLTSGPMRYEAVLHSCGTSPVGGRVPTCDSVYSW